jgi:hypothetical protein
MTITAAYNNDLSRVQLTMLSLTDGLWTVERSRNGTLWETVRGGTGVTVEAGGAALDDYEFDPDVLNHYRVTPIDPPAGLLLNGSTGTYASTPDHAALDITGDLDIRAEFIPEFWPPVNQSRLIAKFGVTGSQCSYQFRINQDGHAHLSWSTNGSSTGAPGRASTAPVPVTAGQKIGIRAVLDVDDGAGNHVVTFYYSTNWTTWTQLGAPVPTSGTTSIFASTTPVSIGARLSPEADWFTGTVTRAEIRNGINGTVVANPDFTAQPGGTTVFADSAGRTWTLAGTATIVDAGDSTTITPSLGGQIWLKSIRYAFLNRTIKVLNFSDIQRASRSGVFEVKGRSVPISVHDLRGSQEFTLEVATRDFDDESYDALTEDRDLDLTLAASDVLFIHVPADLEVPGGYVSIGNTTARRIAPGQNMTRLYTLPCTVVAKPGPDVVSTTMTWATVERLYGSWQQLLASNPTWADLLALVGSPEDLVAL